MATETAPDAGAPALADRAAVENLRTSAAARLALTSGIRNALAFYVLTLLIGEALVVVVLFVPTADATLKAHLAYAGIGLVIGVVVLVTWLAIKQPLALHMVREDVVAGELEKLQQQVDRANEKVDEVKAGAQAELEQYARFDTRMRETESLMTAGRYAAARLRFLDIAADTPQKPVPKRALALTETALTSWLIADKTLAKDSAEWRKEIELALKNFKGADELANTAEDVYLRPIYDLACMNSLLKEYDEAFRQLGRALKVNKAFVQALARTEFDLLPLLDKHPERLLDLLGLRVEDQNGVRQTMTRGRDAAVREHERGK